MKERQSEAEPQEQAKRSTLHWHGEVDPAETRAWLVQDLLPETGKGLVSGQWSTYKTFAVIDLAAAVMAGGSFIDFPIVRRGGVLFIAAEGESEMAVRLQAVLDAKYPQLERAPFAWTASCPQLLGRGAAKALTVLAENELINAFAGAATQVRYLNKQVLLGEGSEIDLSGYATLARTMLRIGARLGLSRRQKDITTLGEYLDQIQDKTETAPVAGVAEAVEASP
jgi:hypothetical protein